MEKELLREVDFEIDDDDLPCEVDPAEEMAFNRNHPPTEENFDEIPEGEKFQKLKEATLKKARKNWNKCS